MQEQRPAVGALGLAGARLRLGVSGQSAALSLLTPPARAEGGCWLGGAMTAAPGTILLVEDDEGIRSLLCDMLRDEGYVVVEAEDGGSAIGALRAHAPPPEALCLVILDMMLPVANGVEVLRTLAELGGYVPVVAMSADRAQLQRAAEAGADVTLGKPFELDRLLSVVERNCHR